MRDFALGLRLLPHALGAVAELDPLLAVASAEPMTEVVLEGGADVLHEVAQLVEEVARLLVGRLGPARDNTPVRFDRGHPAGTGADHSAR
mgnify:CR=1 FL=1